MSDKFRTLSTLTPHPSLFNPNPGLSPPLPDPLTPNYVTPHQIKPDANIPHRVALPLLLVPTQTLNPNPKTLNPNRETPNPNPQTLNPNSDP